MRCAACVFVCLALACTKSAPRWEERSGSGYVVTAPGVAKELTREIADGVTMRIYEYGNGLYESMQIQVMPLPEGRNQDIAIVTMRDHFAKVGTITDEADVPMGDALGKDVRYTLDVPRLGAMSARTRILVQNRTLYQAFAMHPSSKPALRAHADRFVDSFRFTAPSADPVEKLAALPNTTVHQLGAGTVDETGWYSARSANGRFRVEVPAPANEVESDVELGRMHMLATLQLPERIKFVAACFDGDKVQTHDEILAKLGPLEARRQRTVQDRAAVEVDLGGNRSALFLVAGKRTCMLTVEPLSKHTPRPVADAKRFFGSFALVE